MKKLINRLSPHRRTKKIFSMHLDRYAAMLSGKNLAKIFFLFFTLYLLFSVAYASFDRHWAAPSNTCAICSFNQSLLSAISQIPIIIHFDLDQSFLPWIEEIAFFKEEAFYPLKSNRGPPLLPDFPLKF